ncbi:hypothetical protein BBP40_000890 [Aspergillus hancockii]|nr:hypothetical protein BBP40_000890 [Aspergillus hancockii]
MSQIPTPPASHHGSESPDAESKQSPADSSLDLLQSLDTLLERYLHLLDRHQKLQADLATNLSSGFISLAQANYNCPPGRRYGADYYDERMKATRRVALEPPTPSIENAEGSSLEDTPEKSMTRGVFRRIFTIESVSGDVVEQPESTDENNQSKSCDAPTSESASSDEKTIPKIEDSTPSSESSEIQAAADSGSKTLKQNPGSSDPIRWYGILVSPFLRSAQKSFTEAVEGALLELASVVVEMQAVEEEVKRVRSELGQS